MDKSRHAHDNAGGRGGRLRQRLAQILRHSSCATTSTTAFVGVATTNNAAPPATVVTTNAAARQEPPPLCAAHEPQPKLVHGRCHRRRSSSRALVHISIDCSSRSVLPSSPAPARDARAVKRDTRKKGNKLSSLLYSWSSSSSSDTDDNEPTPFSSEGERGQATAADTRSSTVFSSHSFSSDSTVDFYSATGSSRRRHKNTPPRRRAPKPRGGLFRPTTTASAAAGKHHEEEEKKKKQVVEREDDGYVAAAGSTAVVKRSHNPYADFRRSMVEMVSSGRRLRGADALSELLVWYLSLNSPQHHPAILAAFEDVWEAVLGNDDPCP